jgi:hypothetical protein
MRKAHDGLSSTQTTNSKTGQNHMNDTDVIVSITDRNAINRCNCPKCKGCAGTARVCFNSRKLASRTAENALAKAVGLLLLLACFFLQGQATAGVTLPVVSPTDPGQNDKVSVGYLTVFSSTEEAQWGEGPYYYVHTGYRIYDSTGKAVKWIANHDSSTDEAPAKVELAPGKYTIWAQSDKDGYVKVPVVIKLARTTAVHLET